MKELEKIDVADMAAMVASFPQLLKVSSPSDDLLSEVVRTRKEGFDGICLLGMGGSAIAGEMCKNLLADTAETPILTIRDYILPKMVNKRWIAVAVSYSGNTEETIAAFKEAEKRGATTFVLTTGGVLKGISSKDRTYLLPAGIQPRAALPIMLAGLLPILETLLNKKLTDFEKASQDVEDATKKWNMSDFTPKILARSLKNNIPLFIGWRHLVSVAYRAKCQVNENSKSVAFNSEIPEMNHNEIEGAFSCSSHPLVAVFLRSGKEDDQTRSRIEATSDIFETDGCKAIHLKLEAKNRFLEILGLTLFLDETSVRLAELYEADPVSVEKISELKRRLGN